MQLKASIDYALRTVLYLAMHGGVCSSKTIAKDVAIPRDYLVQLAQLLRNAGVIDAKAGKSGGYTLAKSPEYITFLEIINAIEEGTRNPRSSKTTFELEVADEPTPSPLIGNMRKALTLALTSYDAYLDSITIDMLIKCSKDTEHVDKYLSQCLKHESERLSREAEAKEYGEELIRVLSTSNVESPLVQPAVAEKTSFSTSMPQPMSAKRASTISKVESKSPAASIEWKSEVAASVKDKASE